MKALVLLAYLCQGGIYYSFVIIAMLAKALECMKLDPGEKRKGFFSWTTQFAHGNVVKLYLQMAFL